MKHLTSSETTTSGHETEPVRKCLDTIPLDLLLDVFSRVPAKSIARFRCVSKLWASVLFRPDFTELFLSMSWTRPRIFFVLKANKKLFYYSSPQPRNSYDDSHLVATRYHTPDPEYFPSSYRAPVCGLVFFHGYGKRKMRVICNPATGDFVILPKVVLKPKGEARSYPDKIEGFYFGYDPIGKQFKLLCVTTSPRNTHLVLTLENGKRSWRKIESKFGFGRSYTIMGDICINGVLYFGAYFDGTIVIVSFDVRSEKFGFINTVEDMLLKGAYSMTMFNCKGKLGVYQEDTIAFWVLEDVGNHKWSKYVYAMSDSVKEIVTENRFVGMTGTGEMVWSPYPGCVSDPLYLYFYNLERKMFTTVEIQGFEELKDHKHYIAIGTFLDYAENVIKNNTWTSQLKHTRNVHEVSCENRALAKEENRTTRESKQSSTATTTL